MQILTPMKRLSAAAALVVVPGLALSPTNADTLWPSDALTKVMRSAQPPTEGTTQGWQLWGARGEVVSGQAVFRAKEDVQASATISDLVQGAGKATISAKAVALQWVRYIDVTRNTKGIPDDELVAKAPTSIPDPYWEGAEVAVKGNRAQPIWIEITVPRDAAAGKYAGTLRVRCDGEESTLPLRLHVWGFEVPTERHLSVVNWWRFPGVGFAHIKPFTDAYYALLDRCCRFLVAHRQTDLHASLGLIQEGGSDEKGFTHDTSRLERYAETAFGAGIRQLQLHSAGRRTAGHASPKCTIVTRPDALRRLAALEKLIKRKGWQRRFAVSICDEPFIHAEESYARAVDEVHQAAPSVRVIEAVEAEYFGDLDIWVPKLSHLNLWYDRFDEVRRTHDDVEMWFYTCCHPVGRYPNRFLDQSVLKARVLHWINYLYDLDGYLHWGLNHFHGDKPFTQEAISHRLPLGDRAVAYPGKEGFLGSIRLSAMRDGIEDFEYLWVLEDRLRRIKERVGKDAFWLDPRQRPLELCRRVVWSFHDYARDANVMAAARKAIAEEIVSLDSDPLLVVQTAPPEGTVVPAGPRNIGVRGLVPPGAKVTLNGKALSNVRPSGYFLCPYFMPDERPTITVTVEHNGKRRTATRTFRLTD